jgi:aspartate kinase
MKVLKFGGTSVGSAERMKALVSLIKNGERKIVVLSAMSGTTNNLVEIASFLRSGDSTSAGKVLNDLRLRYRQVINDLFSTEEYRAKALEITEFHFDYIGRFQSADFHLKHEKAILAQGELLSTSLFYFHLQETGVSSCLLSALNFMRIDKDGEPDYFYIGENIARELEKCGESELIITQGFICRNAQGDIDNLKRGGSDYTASIIGAVVAASEIQIWTDISGFHNNDPRYVTGTSVIRELSFDEAAELAYFGAKILHPSTIIPACEKNIPVILKNTLEPADPGTIITTITKPEDYKAVAAKDGITVLRITSDRMLMAYGFIRKVFEVFETYRTPIDMIATSEVSVSLTTDFTDNIGEIERELSRLGSVEIENNQTIICIVGDFRTEKTGSAPEIFEALNNLPVKMISYGASRNSISILVDGTHKIEALKSLHKHLFPAKNVQ